MLLSITTIAVICAGLATTAFATDTNSTTTTSEITDTTRTTCPSFAPLWDTAMIMGEQGFRGGPEGHRRNGPGFGGPMGNVELSSEYNQTVTVILSSDTDVQNLISQGYSVTSIKPQTKSVIGADGTVTTKATTATVTMQNGSSGYASVKIDITNAKVTQIVILTRTVIDKS